MDANSCYDHLNEVAKAMHDRGAHKGHIIGALVKVASVISASEFIDSGIGNPNLGAHALTEAFGEIVKSVFALIDDDLIRAAHAQKENETCH